MSRNLDSQQSIDINEPYVAMRENETELDEENINWWALILRVLAFVMLILVIILVGAGTISEKFWLLAAILSVGLILVIILSYYQLKCCYKRDIQRFDRHGRISQSRSTGQLSSAVNNSGIVNPIY